MKIKKIIILLIFVLTTTTFFVGCEQKEISPAIVEAKATTFFNNAVGGSIDPSGTSILEVGGFKVYNFKAFEGYSIKSIKVKDVEQPIVNTLRVQALQPEEFIPIEVEFVHNNALLLNQDYWYLLSLEDYTGDVLSSSSILTATQKSDKTYFNLDQNQTVKAYHQGETDYFGIARWEYFSNNNTIKIGTDMMKVEVLTPYLCTVSKGALQPNGIINYQKTSYWRPKSEEERIQFLKSLGK